jgi:hypothetical protein
VPSTLDEAERVARRSGAELTVEPLVAIAKLSHSSPTAGMLPKTSRSASCGRVRRLIGRTAPADDLTPERPVATHVRTRLVAGLDAPPQPGELARPSAIFQNPDHQIFSATVREELAFGPRVQGVSEVEVARQSRTNWPPSALLTMPIVPAYSPVCAAAPPSPRC